MDLRRVRVGIEIKGVLKFYEGLRVVASGTKYMSALQNEATIAITGLDADTRNTLLKESVQFMYDPTRKLSRITLEVGRVSTGLAVIFQGDIYSAELGNAPDFTVTIKAKTNNANNLRVVNITGAGIEQLSAVAKRVADANGLALRFDATDKQVARFSYSGNAAKAVEQLERAGGINVLIDDGTLIATDKGKPIANRVKILDMNSGMVGIPKAYMQGLIIGVQATILIDENVKIGGRVRINSKTNPSVNGDYVIVELGYNITTHDDPFFYTAKCEPI